ncbi:MAG: 3-keto-disaccharide hydrolase [Rhodanobacter sp.]
MRILAAIALAFVVSPAVSADMPAFAPQKLVLKDIPAAAGPAVALFNGSNLDQWDAWLGYADPGQTYLAKHDAPVGVGGKGSIFSVTNEDGEPAIHVNGPTWGSLVHRGDYANYHLRLEYKWGKARYAPRQTMPPNNGLLYHTHGAPGAVWGTWARSVEFEIMSGSVGMVVPVGDGLRVTTTAAHDASIIDPKLRFMVGGVAASAIGNTATWNVENNYNADAPDGEWNVLDLYVVGNHAIHVVNGVPVMEVRDICEPDAAGVCRPLTHGHIQLQSEGAETFFRRITVEPIARLPVIAVDSRGTSH